MVQATVRMPELQNLSPAVARGFIHSHESTKLACACVFVSVAFGTPYRIGQYTYSTNSHRETKKKKEKKQV